MSVGNVAPWTIPFVLGSISLFIVLQGVRWWVLLKAFEPQLKLRSALRCHLTGGFYSTVLPTSFALDAVRGVLLSRTVNYSVTWGATWLCKLAYLMFAVILSTYGLTTIQREFLPERVIQGILVFFAIMILAVAASFSKRLTQPVRRALNRFAPGNYLKAIENVRQCIYEYRNKRSHLLAAVVLTLLVQLLGIVGTSITILGISGEMHLRACLAFIPVIDIVALALPLTPNGIGIREGLLAVMFYNLGMSNEALGIFVVLARLSEYMIKLALGAPFVFGIKTSKNVQDSTEADTPNSQVADGET